MNNPLTRAADSIKPASPSRLSKTYKVSLKKIIAILLIVSVAFSSYAWVVDRLNTHKNWMILIDEARDFRGHIERAYVTIGGEYNIGSEEIRQASNMIWMMLKLDTAHQNKLGIIAVFLDNAHGLNSVNATVDLKTLNTIQSSMREIGPKIFLAYAGFTENTRADSIDGPPLWYFGPAPPDEAILQEAVDLALNTNALIEPILKANY